MATQQVLIELIPDTSKIQSALAEIEAGGGGDVAAYKATNAELQKRTALMAQVESAEKKHVNTMTQIQKAASTMGTAMVQATSRAAKSATDLSATFEDVYGELKPLTTRLGELEDRMYELAVAGQRNTKEFKELQAEAVRFRRTIIETDEAVDAMASRTAGFDRMLEGAQAVTAGFAIAEGAAALWGEENEELQQTLLKVNAAMAILAGLQQVQDLLTKQHIISLLTLNKYQGIRNAQLALETAAQSKNIIVKGAATVAQKALNAAMALSPTGVLVTGITAVIAAFAAYKGITSEASRAQKEYNERQQALRDINTKAAESAAEVAANLRTLEARFRSASATARDKREVVQELNAKYSDQVGELKGVADAERFFAERAPAFIQATILRAQAQEALNVIVEKTRQNLTLTGYEEIGRMDALWAYIRNFGSIGGTATTVANQAEEARKRTLAANNKLIEDLQKQYANLSGQASKIAQQFNFNFSTAVTKATEDKPIKIVLEPAMDVEEIDRWAAQVIPVRKKEIDKSLAMQEAYNNASLQLEAARLNRLANDPNLSEAARFAAAQAARMKELEILEKERSRINRAALQSSELDYAAYQEALTQNTIAQEEKRAEVARASAEQQKQLYQQLAQEIGNALSMAYSAVFDILAQKRQADLDNALAKLEQEKEASLRVTNLTAKQKEEVEKRFQNEQRRIRNEAARRERKAQTTQIIAEGVVAVAKTLAAYGLTPAGLIAAGAAGAKTIALLAKLAATPLTGYRKGTRSAKKGLAWVGEDGPELIEMSGGEKVWTAPQSRRVKGAWDRGVMAHPDEILRGNIPSTQPDMLSALSVGPGGNMAIDYDRLAMTLARHMPAPMQVNNSIDRNGVHTWIVQGNSRQNILNSRYKTGN